MGPTGLGGGLGEQSSKTGELRVNLEFLSGKLCDLGVIVASLNFVEIDLM